MLETFQVPSWVFFHKELSATGSALNPFTHLQAMRVAASGRIQLLPLVSGKIPVEELQATLERGYTKDDIKILVEF